MDKEEYIEKLKEFKESLDKEYLKDNPVKFKNGQQVYINNNKTIKYIVKEFGGVDQYGNKYYDIEDLTYEYAVMICKEDKLNNI